jgi:hypothetical protein
VILIYVGLDLCLPDMPGAFVFDPAGSVESIAVARGRHFEVTQGLRDGERIVGGTYQAIRELKDGTLVREAKKDDKKALAAKS